MRRILSLMSVLIVSTAICADETQVNKGGEQVTSTNLRLEKNKNSLIKQSTKKADIDDEVDTQALKLGGIHRREDARQYLEQKSEMEQNHEQSDDKAQNQKESPNVMTQK
ncbi:hypothetical protein [Acinetobacter colistiniresistens]|uniref:Uncharacterized protein n=1 Tax=Acinetobacter colistiniresistens TaxID=280145 RepID=S3TIZ7_9GAMM|nr:hypothetical protein [Acinetobacter colistiniresistens]EPG39674.1 hypothetical protein F907_00981 [Acinetobacter colistiniresistens]TVT76766.1 hypothetical protein FPV60_19745 [Acinetobacter colistiniresistens]